jgi:hypothetical protein
MRTVSFACWLCGQYDDQLPYSQGFDFAHM